MSSNSWVFKPNSKIQEYRDILESLILLEQNFGTREDRNILKFLRISKRPSGLKKTGAYCNHFDSQSGPLWLKKTGLCWNPSDSQSCPHGLENIGMSYNSSDSSETCSDSRTSGVSCSPFDSQGVPPGLRKAGMTCNSSDSLSRLPGLDKTRISCNPSESLSSSGGLKKTGISNNSSYSQSRPPDMRRHGSIQFLRLSKLTSRTWEEKDVLQSLRLLDHTWPELEKNRMSCNHSECQSQPDPNWGRQRCLPITHTLWANLTRIVEDRNVFQSFIISELTCRTWQTGMSCNPSHFQSQAPGSKNTRMFYNPLDSQRWHSELSETGMFTDRKSVV